MLINAWPAVSLNRSVTPDSRNRLPNINIPTSGAQEGIAKAVSTVMNTGKMMTAVCETGRAWGMLMARSSAVVNRRMIGGWITGTSAM